MARNISIDKLEEVHENYFILRHTVTLNCQGVVDSRRRFFDLYLGIPKCTNNVKVLHRSTHKRLAMLGGLFDASLGMEG